MHRLAVLALPGVVPFDLSVPCEVFGRARLADGSPAYRVQVCSPERDLDAGWFELRTRASLRALAGAQTIVVPGVADIAIAPPPSTLAALRRAAERGTRIASLCSGAFTLARAGLLDGRRATTHWLITGELARCYARVRVDPNVLFVDEGAVLTSAGAAAALDLCLHMIRRDFGAEVASRTARLTVMPLERSGGQAQFIDHAPPSADGSSLEPILRWLEQSRDLALDVPSIAKRAGMSIRTLLRRFREQTGSSPKQYLIRARVRRSQHLLETSRDSVEQIAGKVGFGSAVAFRAAFVRIVGTSPASYRVAFRAKRLRRA